MPNWDDCFGDDDQDTREGRSEAWHQYDPSPNRRSSVIATPEKRQTKTWNGVPVRSMESDHIMNSILYCERKFSEAITHHENCFPNHTRDNFYFLTVYDMFPEYVNLRNEWDKRMENK